MKKVDVDFHREEEDRVVEVKGLITRYTLQRSIMKKGRGSMGTYLENSSTTVSWN